MKRLRRAFYSDREGRPRALWRIFVTALILGAGFLLTSVLVIPTVLAGVGIAGGLVLTGVILIVVTSTALSIAARFVDHRTVADFGLRIDRTWWLDLVFGLGLGAALMTLVFLTGYGLGWYRVTGFVVAEGPFLPLFLGFTALFIFVGVYEELLARGYLLTNVAEGTRILGEWAAVVIAIVAASLVFGVLHATNPGASALSTASISLAGVMLALGYVLTGELGVPIGVHVTWNLFQGPVYGLGVSGLNVGVALVGTEPVGPELVTGGEFGPEAGLLGVGAVLVGSSVIAGYAHWREGRVRIHPAITEPTLRTDLGAGTDSAATEAVREEAEVNDDTADGHDASGDDASGDDLSGD